MLKRRYRLSSRVGGWEKQVFTNPFFVLKTRENAMPYGRFGIVVSKKVDKKAVVRNRIRRIISSCLEELHKNIKEGYDTLFIVRKQAAVEEKSKMLLVIKEELQKVGLIK